ncbi:MAG: DUF1464 family protein [Solirubrobacterales bacterium]|nr:DUF1464 family protein [Solirubrobacterales bacterium]MBV9714474.1 DUF1464 family protein [Solirubrobacterales bacterium]
MPRVAGLDPGTVSFDLCVLRDGEPVLERVFDTGLLREDSGPLLETLARHGPYDLLYGPSGYGLPLVAAADVGERELAEMVLVRPDQAHADTGVGGMRSLLRALARSGLPVVFGPGVIHLPSVPRHRKYNRIDLGTADKVCAAAYAIADQSARRAIAPGQTAMVLLELGGAFTAAVAIAEGQIVDGVGGSSGPLGVRAAGALDGELAYLLGPALRKETLFTGGALDPGGALQVSDLRALWSAPAHADGWTALLEAAAKAVRALTVSVPAPHEIVVSGRLARVPQVVAALAAALEDLAPVIALVPGRASAAAHGGALLADALAGGRHAVLAEILKLRESSGTALDHLRVAGSDSIVLG